jgi:hypothetical protein
VQASLNALRAGAELARTRPTPPALAAKAEAMKTAPRPLPDKAASPALAPLLARIRTEFPPAAWPWLGEGLARVADWQDADYGREYLDQVARFASAIRPRQRRTDGGRRALDRGGHVLRRRDPCGRTENPRGAFHTHSRRGGRQGR